MSDGIGKARKKKGKMGLKRETACVTVCTEVRP